jgi:hypothetical protein
MQQKFSFLRGALAKKNDTNSGFYLLFVASAPQNEPKLKPIFLRLGNDLSGAVVLSQKSRA